MEYLSKLRYDEIAAELDHLINEVYPSVKDDLVETRAQGDLSENAGYREARRNQAKTISRIRFLQKVLEYSRVIDPGFNSESVLFVMAGLIGPLYPLLNLDLGCLQRGHFQSSGRSSKATPSCSAGS